MARRRRPPRAGALAELQPLRTAAQIATLQALFYLIALILITFTTLVAGMPFSMDMLFDWEVIRGDTTQGWLLAFVWLFDGGFCMAVAIVILIARSKLVPDFALTVQFLHLLATGLYTHSIPINSMWWLTLFGSAVMSISLGMWGCQYRELQPVFFGGRILNTNSSTATGQTTSEPEAGDDEGDDLGRGKGRGKDGQGEYEMVQMGSRS